MESESKSPSLKLALTKFNPSFVSLQKCLGFQVDYFFNNAALLIIFEVPQTCCLLPAYDFIFLLLFELILPLCLILWYSFWNDVTHLCAVCKCHTDGLLWGRGFALFTDILLGHSMHPECSRPGLVSLIGLGLRDKFLSAMKNQYKLA